MDNVYLSNVLKQIQDLLNEYEQRISALETKVKELSKPHQHDDLARY